MAETPPEVWIFRRPAFASAADSPEGTASTCAVVGRSLAVEFVSVVHLEVLAPVAVAVALVGELMVVT